MQGQNSSLSAQYYNSDLSIWLSVDPMVDKYPNLSPYTYCADNPVRLVDPEGKDIYEFDGAGNIINVAECDYDIFYKIDDNGSRTGEYLAFNNKVVTDNIIIDGPAKSSFYLKIENTNDAEHIFSFISECVEKEGGEFSNSLVNDNYGNTFSLIGSDIYAKAGENYSIPNLLNNTDYYVLDCIHNHYAMKQSPSNADVYYAKKNPKTNFSIRTAGDICTPYNAQTPPDYDIQQRKFPLKEIEIKPELE